MKKHLLFIAIVLFVLSCNDKKQLSSSPGVVKEIELQLPFNHTTKKVKVLVRDSMLILDGDIIIGYENQLKKRPEGIKIDGDQFLWPGGTIPYFITPNHPAAADIGWAINHINSNSNIKLVPRTNQADYIVFVPGDVCQSPIGRRGGVQNITLASDCGKGAAVHEILHSAGLFHEQSREDRNNFVRINYGNIEPGLEYNFQQFIDESSDIAFYDYNSIMHYGARDFSRNGQNTIDVLSPPAPSGTSIGQRNGLSDGDKYSISLLYPLYLLEVATPLDQTMAGGYYHFSDWNGDGKLDLFQVVASRPSGPMEITILSGATNFQTILNHFVTALPGGNYLRFGDWDKDGKIDLIGVTPANTASGKIEIHAVSAASNFTSFIAHIATFLIPSKNGYEFQLGDWDGDGRLDLITIWRIITQSNKTEVHIVSAASNFQKYILEVPTVLGESAGRYEFQLTDWNKDGRPDIAYFFKDRTVSLTTELHVMSGATNFSSYLTQKATGFGQSDNRWHFEVADWDGDGKNEILGVYTTGTNSRKIEVHILKQPLE